MSLHGGPEKGESFTIGFVCGQSFKREVVDLGLLRMFEWTASVGIVRSELGPQILRCSFCPSCIPLIGMLLRLFVALSLHGVMKIVKSRLWILVRLRAFLHCILSLHAMLKSVKSQQLILVRSIRSCASSDLIAFDATLALRWVGGRTLHLPSPTLCPGKGRIFHYWLRLWSVVQTASFYFGTASCTVNTRTKPQCCTLCTCAQDELSAVHRPTLTIASCQAASSRQKTCLSGSHSESWSCIAFYIVAREPLGGSSQLTSNRMPEPHFGALWNPFGADAELV